MYEYEMEPTFKLAPDTIGNVQNMVWYNDDGN